MTMTPGDIARVLGAAASVDARTVGVSDISSWHRIIGDLDAHDAIEAVARHYGESTDRVMPAHIRRIVAIMNRGRKRAAREERERLAIEAERADPSRGDRSDNISDVIAGLRTMLPDGHPDKLRRPEWVAWERAQARIRRADLEARPSCICSRGYTLSEDGTEIINCHRCNPNREAS